MLELGGQPSLSPWRRLSVLAGVAAVAVLLSLLFRAPSFGLFGSIPLVLYATKALFGNAAAPLGLHGTVWLGTLGITALGLSPAWQTTWQAETWIALIGSEVLFALGCILSLVGRTPTKSASAGSANLRLAIIGAFALGAFAFVVQLRAVGGPSALISDPVRAREEFVLPGYGYLYGLLYLIPGLAIAYRASARTGRKLVLALSLLSLLLTFVTIARFGILMTLGVAGISLVLIHQRRRLLLPLAGLAVVGALVFTAIDLVKESIGFTGSTSTARIESGEVRMPKAMAPLVWPYLYIIGGYENFDYQLATAPSNAGGMYTFRGVLTPLGGAKRIEQMTAGTTTRVPYTKGYFLNTSIYITDYYLDFGWLGIVVFPFLVGYVSSLLFRFRNSSPVMQVAAAFVLYCLIMTFFSNYFTYSPILFFLSFLIAVHVACYGIGTGQPHLKASATS